MTDFSRAKTRAIHDDFFREYDLGLAFGDGERIGINEESLWVSMQLAEMLRTLEKLAAVVEWTDNIAIGAPGEPGNPNLIGTPFELKPQPGWPRLQGVEL